MLAVLVGSVAFVLPAISPSTSSRRAASPTAFFDLFKESPEQKAAKDRAFQEQQEMLRRRRDPELMKE